MNNQEDAFADAGLIEGDMRGNMASGESGLSGFGPANDDYTEEE